MMKDEKMMDEMVQELAKAGIKKEQIDEKLTWGVMKLMLGVMKIKMSLKENGLMEDDSMEKLNKIMAMVAEKDADELHKMVHMGEEGGKEDWM